MAKQIVSEMVWKESELAQLPIEKNFRMRGLETTRLDTLIDAGFAFVLSFLAISQEQLPTSFEELVVGLKSIPALTLSFLTLMWFWLEHRRWSRRYGVESGVSILLSIGLVFVVLVYIFPLRLLFESLFDFLSSGYLPFNFQFESSSNVRHFFGLYSVGYFVMSSIFVGLYSVVLKKRSSLMLNAFEYQMTKMILIRWLMVLFFALMSLVLAYTLSIQKVHYSAFLYFALPLVQLTYSAFGRKKLKAALM